MSGIVISVREQSEKFARSIGLARRSQVSFNHLCQDPWKGRYSGFEGHKGGDGEVEVNNG